MAYRINGVIRLSDQGDANLGIATATEFDGKVTKKAITEQTAGDDSDITGADELLIYDQQTDSLLRVSVDDFVSASGIGTIVTDFENINVSGLSTISNVQFNLGIVTASSPTGVVTFYGDGSNLTGINGGAVVSDGIPTGVGTAEGSLYYDSSLLKLFTYYDNNWVEAAPSSSPDLTGTDQSFRNLEVTGISTIAGKLTVDAATTLPELNDIGGVSIANSEDKTYPTTQNFNVTLGLRQDIEIGGTQVSGIDVGEEYNKKWQSPIGTRKYNKDAFIIIKNQDRRDLTKSEPFSEGEFKPAHPYQQKK